MSNSSTSLARACRARLKISWLLFVLCTGDAGRCIDVDAASRSMSLSSAEMGLRLISACLCEIAGLGGRFLLFIYCDGEENEDRPVRKLFADADEDDKWLLAVARLI